MNGKIINTNWKKQGERNSIEFQDELRYNSNSREA